MYIDIVLLVLIVIAVIFYFRRFSSFVYLICSLDILYRLLHFIADNVKVEELSSLINKYIPTSVPGIVAGYTGTESIFYTIALWCMFVIYRIDQNNTKGIKQLKLLHGVVAAFDCILTI